MTKVGAHAIVIGASMGGLLAARALSEFYETVTLVERDAFPASDVPRKGVPQARHPHGLLARGREAIEDFFPGWTEEVVASGGGQGDIGADASWVGHGVALKRAESGMIGLLASRPVLEGCVRRRLLALPNVRAIENRAVAGLVASDDNAAIKGVCVRAAGQADRIVMGDLVVDASGRGSQSPAWLEALGYTRPEEETVEIGLGYTTREYRRSETDLGGKVAVVIAASGPNWRGGAMLFQTADRWIVMIGGFLGDHAPAEEKAFAAYARSLPTPDIHDIVAHAEPVTDFVTYRFPANLRRRYERLAQFPKNYIVFADALCSFNPVYGQGMTVAAQEAALLRACLRDGGAANLARRFFKAAKAAIDAPWDIAVGNDLRHPGVVGPRPARVRFINWYIGKLHLAAERDSTLANAFLRVANLMAPPQSLLHPAIVARVIRGNSRLDPGRAAQRREMRIGAPAAGRASGPR